MCCIEIFLEKSSFGVVKIQKYFLFTNITYLQGCLCYAVKIAKTQSPYPERTETVSSIAQTGLGADSQIMWVGHRSIFSKESLLFGNKGLYFTKHIFFSFGNQALVILKNKVVKKILTFAANLVRPKSTPVSHIHRE